MKRPRISISGWIFGTLAGVIAANVLLVCFVTGVDVYLGHPPQFMIPIFALLFASTVLLYNRRASKQSRDSASEEAFSGKRRRARMPHRKNNAPAYLSMMIIRRAQEQRGSVSGNEWGGSVQ